MKPTTRPVPSALREHVAISQLRPQVAVQTRFAAFLTLSENLQFGQGLITTADLPVHADAFPAAGLGHKLFSRSADEARIGVERRPVSAGEAIRKAHTTAHLQPT